MTEPMQENKKRPMFSKGNMFLADMDEMVKRAREILKKGPLPSMVDWATAFSLWPVHLMTSCCGCEIGAAWGPRFDNERYGSLPWVSPRQTNLIIVEGTVTRKMGCSVRITWEQMPYPKFAIAMGVCALDGGLFYNSYNIIRPWRLRLACRWRAPGPQEHNSKGGSVQLEGRGCRPQHKV